MFQISQIPTKPTKPMEILQEPANTLQISYGYPTLPSENSYKNYKLQNPTEILCTPCRCLLESWESRKLQKII